MSIDLEPLKSWLPKAPQAQAVVIDWLQLQSSMYGDLRLAPPGGKGSRPSYHLFLNYPKAGRGGLVKLASFEISSGQIHAIHYDIRRAPPFTDPAMFDEYRHRLEQASPRMNDNEGYRRITNKGTRNPELVKQVVNLWDWVLEHMRSHRGGLTSTPAGWPSTGVATLGNGVDREFDVGVPPNPAAPTFDPEAVESDRRRRLAAITERRGQPAFRRKILLAYEGRCAFTGCDVEEVLEAAHIYPYQGDATDVISNGLLLRSDVHNAVRSWPHSCAARYSCNRSCYAALNVTICRSERAVLAPSKGADASSREGSIGMALQEVLPRCD